MTVPRALSSGVALAALAGMVACAGGGPEPGSPPGPSSSADLEALYRARTDSALARYTEADADFMRHMIRHHAQALDMAALAPGRAESPEVRRLAARITTGQEAEIALMRRWLEERRLLADAEHDHDAAPTPSMPGMLTAAQLRELGAASGGNFDRLFLLYMIQHHEGAVAMVEELFATPGAASHASTFRIASGVQVDQRTEIARMQAMLEALEPPR